MAAYAIVYFGAALVALVSTPLAARLARAMRIMDRPTARKVHATAIPRIGGVAVILAMLAVTIPALLLKVDWAPVRAMQMHLQPIQKQVVVLLAASAFICLVGLIDDIWGLPAKVKLLLQLSAAAAVCAFGIRIGPVAVRGWFETHLEFWSWPLTILWIVGITNAVNLIDGLDGLAAGICAITCAVIVVFALHWNQAVMAMLMLAMLGSLTGFLFFNFNPARIFLGDCGSMFLGFFIATASVMSAAKSYTLVGLALPALALGLPIFDTLFTILRRVLERRSMFAPDRDHIHHRLVDTGLHQRQAVILMYVVTLLAAGIGMFMMLTRDIATLLVFAGALLPVLLIFRVFGALRFKETLSALQRNRALAREAKEDRLGFEQLQVRLSRAADFEQWWRALRRAARELGFARLTLEFENRDGTTRKLVWRLPHRELTTDEMIFLTIPVHHRRAGEPIRADVDVPVNASLESAGRRVALFARLLDQHSLATVPGEPRHAGVYEPEPRAESEPAKLTPTSGEQP